MTPRRKPSPSSKKRLCDDLWRQIIRAQAGGTCERCGKAGPTEAAHIVRRRYAWTRTDEKNGWGLCHFCHTQVDTYASKHASLVERTIGLNAFCDLEFKSMNRAKFDWFAEHERLKELVRAVR